MATIKDGRHIAPLNVFSAANGPILLLLFSFLSSCKEETIVVPVNLSLNLKGYAQFCKTLTFHFYSQISLISKVSVVFIATLCMDTIRAKQHAWNSCKVACLEPWPLNRSIVMFCYIVIYIAPLTGGYSEALLV